MPFTRNYKTSDIRHAAKIVSELLLFLKSKTHIGTNILELEEYGEHFLALNHAAPTNKGYHPAWATNPFPSILCVNVNDEVLHTPVKDYVICDGDLVNIDVGLKFETACGDAATTFVVGQSTDEKDKLLRAARIVLQNAVLMIKPGISTRKIGKEMARTNNRFGYTQVSGYGGHQIGEEMHMPPFIQHGDYGEPAILSPGMVVCLEPIITSGTGEIHRLADGWTEKTNDGSFVAQFESMVLVTDTGHEVLTSHI